MFSENVQKLIRDEFASIGDKVFLSASFTTMPPKRVMDVMPRFAEKWLKTFSNSEWEDWIESEHADCRREVAELLGCDENDIALTKNTTEGVGIVASGYPWTPGNNIVIPQAEHGANLHSWIPLVSRGITLKPVLPRDPHHGLTADEIIDAIDDKTEAVVTSVIQYQDGAFVDMKKLGQACRDRGVLLIVDAIQAVGRMKVDVREWNIDWLACGSHKGLLSTDCAGGILYSSPRMTEKVIPACIGLESTDMRSRIDEPGGCVVHFKKGARRFEGGSSNTLGAMMMAEGCRFIKSIGMENIEEHILDLERYFITQVKGLKNVRIAGDRLGGVVMTDFKPENRDKAIAILDKYNINATIRPANIRFCISMVNRREHMDILARAYEELEPLL